MIIISLFIFILCALLTIFTEIEKDKYNFKNYYNFFKLFFKINKMHNYRIFDENKKTYALNKICMIFGYMFFLSILVIIPIISLLLFPPQEFISKTLLILSIAIFSCFFYVYISDFYIPFNDRENSGIRDKPLETLIANNICFINDKILSISLNICLFIEIIGNYISYPINFILEKIDSVVKNCTKEH